MHVVCAGTTWGGDGVAGQVATSELNGNFGSDGAKAALEAQLSGFSLAKNERSRTRRDKKSFRDLRLGYAVDLEGYKGSLQELKHPSMDSVASMVELRGKDGSSLFVLGMFLERGAVKAEPIVDGRLRNIVARRPELAEAGEGKAPIGKLAGRTPWGRLWEKGAMRFEVRIVNVGARFFIVTTSSDAKSAERLFDRFRILD